MVERVIPGYAVVSTSRFAHKGVEVEELICNTTAKPYERKLMWARYPFNQMQVRLQSEDPAKSVDNPVVHVTYEHEPTGVTERKAREKVETKFDEYWKLT